VTVGTPGWYVVLDGCILNLELTAGISGTANVHGLQTEDVGLMKVSGCHLLKSVLIV